MFTGRVESPPCPFFFTGRVKPSLSLLFHREGRALPVSFCHAGEGSTPLCFRNMQEEGSSPLLGPLMLGEGSSPSLLVFYTGGGVEPLPACLLRREGVNPLPVFVFRWEGAETPLPPSIVQGRAEPSLCSVLLGKQGLIPCPCFFLQDGAGSSPLPFLQRWQRTESPSPLCIFGRQGAKPPASPLVACREGPRLLALLAGRAKPPSLSSLGKGVNPLPPCCLLTACQQGLAAPAPAPCAYSRCASVHDAPASASLTSGRRQCP